MNVAAIINVAPGEAALSNATQTQTLLLEHLGSQLGSIRLAVPRLLKFACLGAIAEKPDVLVVAGGPRAARRAGQIAYAHRLPILFLPGHRSPRWARRLWGALSLEDMVSALARGAVTPIQLPAGIARGQIFFGEAICGVLPHIRQLRDDLAEAETVPAAARLLADAAAACGRVFGPKIVIRCDDATREASAVVVGIQHTGGARQGSFACKAWRQRPLALARASLRAAAGHDWQSPHEPERFNCTTLQLDAGDKTWLLLDGEAIALRGPVELHYLPRTVKTFTFAPERAQPRSPRRDSSRPAQNKAWNHGRFSHV
jgi:diacylglycerol kinase family enzyme